MSESGKTRRELAAETVEFTARPEIASQLKEYETWADYRADIEFPQPVCIEENPHPRHRIEGTWREQCPGRP